MDKHDDNLTRLFNPKSIAVVGASNKTGSVGNSVMKNLIGHFEGIVHPVNPNRTSILGVKAYPSVSKVPDHLDLVVIATPAATVPAIVRECAAKKVGGIVIITAGFKEAGPEGMKLYDEILSITGKTKIRMIGPNCLGFIRPSQNLNASFSSKMALPGKVALISQSGALCTAILDWSVQYNVGFSYFISLGSMADVDFNDMIRYLEHDEETAAILLYMESLSRPREFIEAASSFTRKKPIFALKVGRSIEGASAAKSHTGSITGNDEVFDAAFRRAGIIRVNSSQELYDCAQVLGRQKPPKGNRLAIVTNAGGPGVIATDALVAQGGTIPKLSQATLRQLDKILPAHWSHANPVDVLGDADPERYKAALELCLKDPNVDGALVILTPQSMTRPREIAESLVGIAKEFSDKPILASWMGEDDVELGRRSLEKGNIPVYRVPESGIGVFMTMYRYARDTAQLAEKAEPRTMKKNPANEKIIKLALQQKRNALTEFEAKMFIANYGIPVPRSKIAADENSAAAIAAGIGFPVVMKILSQDIIHKTEAGGVMANINDATQARDAYRKIMRSARKYMPKARLDGVLIEEMVRKKYEILIGSKTDEIFGPTIAFGAGGTAVELIKDVSIELAPLSPRQAQALMEKTKIYSLLKGYRGQKGVDLKMLKDIICRFSYLAADFPQIKEIDINPFSMDEKGGCVLDAKIIL